MKLAEGVSELSSKKKKKKKIRINSPYTFCLKLKQCTEGNSPRAYFKVSEDV